MPSVAASVAESPIEEGGAKRQCRSSVKCEECGEREAKYRCPGCGLRSCGLPCVKSHKERMQCTGKRKRTAFIPVSEYDDNWMISDYNFLEETLRQADAAKRLRAPLGDGGCSGRRKIELHPSLKALQRQAKSRNTSLVFLSNGMSKREANSSFFERRMKRIFWRVEWVFEGTEVRLVDQRVDENLSLDTILAKHLSSDSGDVMVKHRLRNFCRKPFHELKLLLPKENCPAPGKRFYELNHKQSLRNQLVSKTVIEYPVITVVLPEDTGKFAIIAPVEKAPSEAVDDEAPFTPTLHEPGLRKEDIREREPEGVPFREEEIEEGEFVP